MAIAATNHPENAYLAGCMTGRRLHECGVNFNLAPVMDINSNPSNPIICERSYGDTPEQVTAYAVSMMQGLLSEHTLSCLKHFPGHGDTDTDSHLSLPLVDKSKEVLLTNELHPFIQGIAAGAPAIMSAHILFPQLEPDNLPATLSKRILTDLLRKELGFQGLLFSDCLEMQAIQRFWGVTSGCLQAFEAGIDLALISHTQSYAEETVCALEKRALQDKAFLQTLETSVQRILSTKTKYICTPFSASSSGVIVSGCTDGYFSCDTASAYELLRQSITLVSGKLPHLGASPCFLGCAPFCFTGVENTEKKGDSFPVYLSRKLGGTMLEYTLEQLQFWLKNPNLLKEYLAGSTCLVAGIYHADQWPEQLDLITILSTLSIPTIAISLKSPYELFSLPAKITSIAAWEYSEPCLQALSEVLSGETLPSGKLPISRF